MRRAALVGIIAQLFVLRPAFCAEIRTAVVWSGDCRVTETLTVLPSGTLTIDPGTTVAIAANACIMVYGNIAARGQPDRPIVFTRVGHTRGTGYWGKILLDRAVGENRFSFCEFWYGNGNLDAVDTCDGVITAYGSRLSVFGCTTHHFRGDFFNIWTGSDATILYSYIGFGDNTAADYVGEAVEAYRADLEVGWCVFGYREGRVDAIDLYGPDNRLWVHGCIFYGSNLDDGVDFDNCNGIVENCTFYNFIGTAPGWEGRCAGVAMNLTGRSIVRNNVFINCRQGVIIKGDTQPYITNCTFVNCFNDIATYEAGENPPFQVGKPTVRNCIMWRTTSQTLVLGVDIGTGNKSAVDIDYCDVYSTATVYASDPRVTAGSHIFSADPQFVALPSQVGFVPRQLTRAECDFYDLRLRANSPAIGAGIDREDLGAFPFIRAAVERWLKYR